MPQAFPRTIRIKSTHFHGLQNACMGSGPHPPLSVTLTPSGITLSPICSPCFSSGVSKRWAPPMVQQVKNSPANEETQVRFLDWEDTLEKEMAIHSSILAWGIPWTEEHGGLQSTGSQRVRHNWANDSPQAKAREPVFVQPLSWEWLLLIRFLLFSRSVVSNSLQPHGLQHVRPPCPSASPRAAQTHILWISDAIRLSRLLSSSTSLAFDLSQHQGLFQWVSSSHQVAKVLELQFQHQSFHWIFRINFL